MERKGKAALTACSDPVSPKRMEDILRVADILRGEGLDVLMMPDFFAGTVLNGQKKAQLLNDCFADPGVEYIFDVYGGDLANLALPYLDYELIGKSRALFFGYSDLTAILNAITAKTGRWTVNYQVRNVLYDHGKEQLEYFRNRILTHKTGPEELEVTFLRGKMMRGRVLGGNIRCFLKLAGTGYMPDLNGAILLLESLGGGSYQMMTALEQYRQLGIFEKISGILLGTFTNMEKEACVPAMGELVLDMVPASVPVAVTKYIGHYSDARGIILGREICFC